MFRSSACVEALRVEVLVVLEHEVGGTADTRGEDAESLTLAVTTLELLQMRLAADVVA